MSMSSISLVGNLVRSPEQICFASGRIKTVMVIAVNSRAARNEAASGNTSKADYYRIETWGKLAELAQKYLNKGNQVAVSGKLNMERWTDREGNQRTTPVVAATQLSFPPRLKVAGEGDSDEGAAESDDDLFAGARAITVAEPPAAAYMSAHSADETMELAAASGY